MGHIIWPILKVNKDSTLAYGRLYKQYLSKTMKEVFSRGHICN